MLQEFNYVRPDNVNEAILILSSQVTGCAVLAGGTDLLVKAKQGRMLPRLVVDIKSLNLDYISSDKDEIVIGATTSLAEIADSRLVQSSLPGLIEAVTHMASPQVRNRATIGGNLCNAVPSADTAPPLIAYGAKAVLKGPAGERVVPLDEFFLGVGKTCLEPGELMIEVRIPEPPRGSGVAYEKFCRTAKDIAVVGVAAEVCLDERSVCQQCRIVLASVAPTPFRAIKAETVLTGSRLDDDRIGTAAATAVTECAPRETSVRASAEYKRDLVRSLTERALKKALDRAFEGR